MMMTQETKSRLLMIWRMILTITISAQTMLAWTSLATNKRVGEANAADVIAAARAGSRGPQLTAAKAAARQRPSTCHPLTLVMTSSTQAPNTVVLVLHAH